MKGRDSGMPDEEYWSSFFDVPCILHAMLDGEDCQGDLTEIGCGYGTFTYPAALRTRGILHTFDIDNDLVSAIREGCSQRGIDNVEAQCRDVMEQGSGLAPASQAHVMIYNLLHIENPDVLLREALRIMQPGGRFSMIHWRSDIPTPRGPALAIRPTPRHIQAWLWETGFVNIQHVSLEGCCAYHYGMTAQRGKM